MNRCALCCVDVETILSVLLQIAASIVAVAVYLRLVPWISTWSCEAHKMCAMHIVTIAACQAAEGTQTANRRQKVQLTKVTKFECIFKGVHSSDSH